MSSSRIVIAAAIPFLFYRRIIAPKTPCVNSENDLISPYFPRTACVHMEAKKESAVENFYAIIHEEQSTPSQVRRLRRTNAVPHEGERAFSAVVSNGNTLIEQN